MKRCTRLKIANALGCNADFNRKILCLKRSWDEVEAIINKCNKCKPKDCNKHKRCD